MGMNYFECLEKEGGFWRSRDFNFDDMGEGMISLFIFASLEAWP